MQPAPTPSNVIQLLTVEDVCQRLQIARRTVYDLIASNQLPPPMKFGRASRWHEADIARLIADAEAAR
jgi:excisionase family DNA binding protein